MATNDVRPDGNDLGPELADRLRRRAAAMRVPVDGMAFVAARIEHRHRNTKILRVGAVSAAVGLIVVSVVLVSLGRADNAQQIFTGVIPGTTTSVTASTPGTFGSTTPAAISTEAPETFPANTSSSPTTDPTTTVAPATTSTTSVASTTSTTSAPSTQVAFSDPGLPRLVVAGAAASAPINAPGQLPFAFSSAAWVSEDWKIAVVERLTDSFVGLPVDSATVGDWCVKVAGHQCRAVGDGRYLLSKPETDGWAVYPIFQGTAGSFPSNDGKYYISGDDGGYHVSGSDETTAVDLVQQILVAQPDRPLTLMAGSTPLTLVKPSSGSGYSISYNLHPTGPTVSINVKQVGASGWRGETANLLRFGGSATMKPTRVGGSAAWIVAVPPGLHVDAGSAVIWQPNSDYIVVIQSDQLDTATLESVIGLRLQRVNESTWRETVPPSAP